MILIENELIFLAVPKNASMSVHYAFEESTINFEPAFPYKAMLDMILKNEPNYFSLNNHKIKIHPHYTTAEIYSNINKKLPTIFIKREYSDRFLSALNYIFNIRIPLVYPQLIPVLHNIDNEWIYKNVTHNVIENIKIFNPTDMNFHINEIDSPEDCVHRVIIHSLNKLTRNKVILKKNLSPYNDPFPKNKLINFKILDSQEIYKSGYIPKYIFDISELDRLEKMMMDRYGKILEIKKENVTIKSSLKTNFVNDSKLKDWAWNNFEKHHFQKKLF
jgi:hypothetical protein